MSLFLLPNVLSEEGAHDRVLPKSVDEAVASIDGLIAESRPEAYRFLRRFAFIAPKTFRDIPIQLLNEHSSDAEMDELLKPLLKGECWGLISDCGMPCLADPGSEFVLKAYQKGIVVESFAGPSSILLALVLSGLGGQRFTFHGYLPKEGELLKPALKEMQQRSLQEKSTQLFIEAPYRNEKMFTCLLQVLHDQTLLCIAADLTASSQWVSTQSIQEWKKGPIPQINKRPAIFLIKKIK